MPFSSKSMSLAFEYAYRGLVAFKDFFFPTRYPSQLTRISTNPHLRWEPNAGHKVLQLQGLALGSKPNQTPKPYPVVDKPLGHTCWLVIFKVDVIIKIYIYIEKLKHSICCYYASVKPYQCPQHYTFSFQFFYNIFLTFTHFLNIYTFSNLSLSLTFSSSHYLLL